MEEKMEEKEVKKINMGRILYLILTLLLVLAFAYMKVGDMTQVRNLEKENNVLAEKVKNQEYTICNLQKVIEELKGVPYEEKFSEAIKKLQPRLDPSLTKIITNSILRECKERALDPELILAIAFVESGFNPMAESVIPSDPTGGAVGIMQVKYKTWKEQPELKDNGVKAKHHLFWIDANIKCGTTIFRKYYDEAKGNLAKTLWRYNSGKELQGDPLSVVYINKVTYTLALIRELMFHKTDVDTDVLLEPLNPKKIEIIKPVDKKEVGKSVIEKKPDTKEQK